MKRKALITGAQLHPFEGPWVVLESDKDWEFEGVTDAVRVEREGDRARAVIGLGNGSDVNVYARISVVAVEVAA